MSERDNQIREFLRLAVEQGTSVFLHVHTPTLRAWGDSGIPQDVLDDPEQAVDLKLQLDRAYYSQMDINISDNFVFLNLGFDTLRRCVIPYAAVLALIPLFGPPETAVQRATPPAAPAPKAARSSHLALVQEDDGEPG